MIARIPFPRFISFPKVVDLFTPLLFLYFVTLHADQLNFQFGGTIRFNNLLALGLLIVLMVRLRKDLFKIDKWLTISLSAIIFSVLISMFFTPYFHRCLLFACWFFWTLLCYFWLPYQMVIKLDSKRILHLYFTSFLVVGAYGFSQLITGPLGDPFVGQYITSFIGRPNAFSYEPSYYVLYMTPFVIYQTCLFLNGDKAVSGKRMCIIYLFYLSSMSAGAIASLMVFFSMILFHKKMRKNAALFLFKIAIALSPLFILMPSVAMNFLLKNGQLNAHFSATDRINGMLDCLALFKKRPLIGYGLGAVAPVRVHQESFQEKYNVPEGANLLKAAEPTNISSEVLASLGLVGGAAFCLMILVFVITYIKNRKNYKHDALLIAFFVMLINWQFNQSLMRPYCWTFFAIAAALLKTNLQSGLSPSQEESGQMLDTAF